VIIPAGRIFCIIMVFAKYDIILGEKLGFWLVLAEFVAFG